MTVVEIEKRIFQPNKYGTIKENLQNNTPDMLEVDTIAKSKRIMEVEDAILRVQTARVRNEKDLYKMQKEQSEQEERENAQKITITLNSRTREENNNE
ncbi:MAG: hypothetical protein FWG64_03045 [Firmicutes bacterium]|nr:hypothetical protein [Bacillota bacterium]